MATKIQLRRDLSASWTSSNPILAQGEPGLETDTGKIKYGTGTTAWVDLEYASSGGGVVDGNVDVTRATQGTLTTLKINTGANYGYTYHDAITRSSGNIYLAGGFYSSDAQNFNGYNQDTPLLTKVDSSGTVVASKFIWEDSQSSWSHGAGVTVNPNSGNITVVGVQYINGYWAPQPFRHEISADLTSVTSTRYEIPSAPWAWTRDSALLPNGTTISVGGHDSGIAVTYSNVQPHPGSYVGYLGLNIVATFGSNSTPTANNGWYITGYNTGGTDITDINYFSAAPSSSTSADGNSSLWGIGYAVGSNVYVVGEFNGGQQYLTGDAITIHGNELGGNITTNDLTITVGNVDSGGTILDYTLSGVAQTDLIWLKEGTGVDFGNLPPGEQWNVLQSTGTNGWIMTDSWIKSLGGNNYDYINSVTTDTGGNIYVGGRMQSGNGLRANNASASVTKLNSSGVIQWTKFVDFDGGNEVYGLAVDTTGNVVVTGKTNFGYMFAGKMNPATGSMYWRTTIGTDGNNTDPMGFNTVTNPVFATGGNVIVAGQFNAMGSRNDDIFVASFDANTGNVAYQRSISADSDQYMTWQDSKHALVSDGDNYYVTYVTTANNEYATLVKLPTDGTDPVYLNNGVYYDAQDWTTLTQTNPSIINDDANSIQISTETWTPVVMTTSLVDALTYTTATTANLLLGNTGHIKGVAQLEFEDGTSQDSAAITARSTYEGTAYHPMNIRVYNGGINFTWNGTDDVLWFNSDNAPSAVEGLQAVGAIIEYQLYSDNHYGVQIGTIHVSSFYDNYGEAAHTENWAGNNNNMMYNKPWILNGNNYNRVELYFRGAPSSSGDIKIQWTARVFYGQENYC